jgi:hypothetical protein
MRLKPNTDVISTVVPAISNDHYLHSRYRSCSVASSHILEQCRFRDLLTICRNAEVFDRR